MGTVAEFPLANLPTAPEAERSILGALFANPAIAAEVIETCRPEWFEGVKHKAIYEAMQRIVRANGVIDYTTIVDELRSSVSRGASEAIGELSNLHDSMPRLENIDHYIGIVREKAQLRALAKAGTVLTAEAMSGDWSPDEIAERVTARLGRITDGTATRAYDESAAIIGRLNETVSNPDRARGVCTGYRWLDSQTNGIKRQHLWLLAAYTSIGKSSFAASIGISAIRAGYWVDVLTYEMTGEEYMARMISGGWRIRLGDLERGRIHADDYPRYKEATEELGNSRLRICEASGMTTGDIRARAERYRRRGELDLMIVDYLALIEPGDSRRSEAETINRIAQDLKTIAGKTNCAILALHQINREGAKAGGEPQLYWLRYAGESHANAVLFLTRDDADSAGLWLKKNRSGPTGDVPLRFVRDYAVFEEIR